MNHMNFIPLLKTEEIRKQKQIADFFTMLSDRNQKISSVYLLDKNGVEKNQPALSTHQYAQRWFNTIVDAGCQDVGDVVDILLTGAQIVVIRPNLWREKDLLSVRDISESELYLWYDPQENLKVDFLSTTLSNQADGLIIYFDHVRSPIFFDIRENINKLISVYSKEKIILFDSFKIHQKELGDFGLSSTITNMNDLQEYGDK